jgi:NodT family efflux transporter outer membrane factor (OMF) lipoprotein
MILKHKYHILIVLLIGGVLSCSVPKEANITKQAVPQNYNEQSADSTNSGSIHWKTFFKDEKLQKLIDAALAQNVDVQMALQQIEISNAYLKMSRGAFFPSAQISATQQIDGNVSGNSGSSGNYSVNLNSSWEIDLWGKLCNSKKAAKARFLASQNGRQLIQSMLIADLSKSYFELMALDLRLDIIEKNIKLQTSALEIIIVQKQAGKATDLAVKQFEAQLHNTQAQKFETERLIIALETGINVLLNRMPQKVERGKIDNQTFPEKLNVGIPVQLLNNRPDLAEASLLLDAAGFDAKAACRAFYPSLVIQPFVGFSAANPSGLFNSTSAVWGLMNGLTAPLFSKKVLKGTYRIKQAEQKQALLHYQHVLVQGISEVQSTIDKIRSIDLELLQRKNEVAVLDSAIAVSNDLYAYGYANYLEVISAQKNVRDAELALTTIQKERFFLVIDLYKALGGGRN